MNFKLSDEQKRIVALVDELGKKEFAAKAAHWDQNQEYPWENVHKLRECDILGMTIPVEYGGQGRPLIDAILAIETAAKYCGVTARIIVETNMGALGCIMAYGTDVQRNRVTQRILKEGDKPAIAMTEPEAGTALTDLQTSAVKKGAKYIINGTKHWITGGGISVTNLVFARFFEDNRELGIGGILVDKGTPGFSFGRVEQAMGLRGIPETELIFKDCEVPQENVVVMGDGNEGFKKLMYGYNGQRVGASAVALGIAQGAHDLAIDYMKKRKAFGRAISEFQGLQWMMAESEIKLNAARLMIYRAACNARDLPNNVKLPYWDEASMAKAYTGHAALEVTSESLQMFGAYGYSQDLPLERMLRDVRMFQIGGGTTQAQLNMVARSIFKRTFDLRK
ncbi:MAG: acyl-CoA dehydrogenase family protein [Deltaproteobacteria bacterium]|nr:MAG: acyl-CoA dehydrogenase family protein [Deltaproteobacteria bacterium]